MSARCEPDNCGSACCSPVMLPYTQTQFLLQNFEKNRQWEWVMNDLTRIPAREGYVRHPQLRGVAMVDQNGEMAFPVFYSCRHCDDETNRCTDYDNRPDTCRDFPWYDNSPEMMNAAALHECCSFNADLGREVKVRIQ